MKVCTNCQAPLLKNAKFCHQCGHKTEENVDCPSCLAPNPPSAQFCHQCGHQLKQKYSFNFEHAQLLPQQVEEAFVLYLNSQLSAEGLQDELPLLIQRFHQSGFKQQYFEEASILLSHFIEDNQGANKQIERKLDWQFFFLRESLEVSFAQDLLPYPLSSKLLIHQYKNIQDLDLQSCIKAHLDLDKEKDLAYTTAVDMPLKKLQQARKIFYKDVQGEIPYIFIDKTFMGSGKEGVIMSNRGLYWKSAFHKSASISYQKLKEVQLFKRHLEINGIYCNLGKSLNYKLYKLLQKIIFIQKP